MFFTCYNTKGGETKRNEKVMEIFFEGSVLESGLEDLAEMLTEKFEKEVLKEDGESNYEH